MTYNYVLNPFIRKRLNIVEKNSIIILDEAHNVCSSLENLFTYTINLDNLKQLQPLLQAIMDFINDNKKFVIKKGES